MKNYLKPLALALAAITLLAFTVQHYQQKHQADDQTLMGMLYEQHAAEYKALCLQAYNWAQLEAQRTWDRATPRERQHLAIVTDLDETVLDNSKGEAYNFKQDKAFDIYNWWLHGQADTIPGSLQFFTWAEHKGFHIYYISNRPDAPQVIDATRTQMKHFGFPRTASADFDQYFLFSHNKQFTKQPRRDYVSSHFGDHIALLLGDNLADLQTAFDREGDTIYTDGKVRWNRVDKFRSDWGRRYIVFPNAYYGDWEGAFYRDYQLKNHTAKTPDNDTKYQMREAQLDTLKFE